MISIIEQGFLRRNWGKLALGGGALALAASRGEDMGMGAAGEAAGTRMGNRVKNIIRGDNPMLQNIKNTAKDTIRNPNDAIQKGAASVGAGVRKVTDFSRETIDSAKKGYSGEPTRPAPNVPRVAPGVQAPGTQPPGVIPMKQPSWHQRAQKYLRNAEFGRRE